MRGGPDGGGRRPRGSAKPIHSASCRRSFSYQR